MQADGITEEELAVAVGYLSGSTVLALEDPGTRMARLGAGELTKRGVVPIGETLAGYAAVTPADVARGRGTCVRRPRVGGRGRPRPRVRSDLTPVRSAGVTDP